MLLDHLFDFALKVRGDVSGGNLFEESSLAGSQVRAEVSLPLGDLVDGDGVELQAKR